MRTSKAPPRAAAVSSGQPRVRRSTATASCCAAPSRMCCVMRCATARRARPWRCPSTRTRHRPGSPMRDRGPGVPAGDLERIFEPFYRVAESRDRDSGGEGIGLAITAQVMKAHGGSAEARNRADGGLEVLLSLPRSVSRDMSRCDIDGENDVSLFEEACKYIPGRRQFAGARLPRRRRRTDLFQESGGAEVLWPRMAAASSTTSAPGVR